MSKKIISKKKFLLIILFCVPSIVHAELMMSFYSTLYATQSFIDDLPSSFEFDFVVTTASEAFATDEKELVFQKYLDCLI
jgi:hypothetical protein